MTALFALAAGALFGAGLVFAGMVDPAKVLNFLDIAGAWDPSLALVMAAAIPVAAAMYALARRRAAPLAGGRFHWPAAVRIDPKLIAGAVLFGLGWGLAGYCPGPALAALGFGAPGALLFVGAMLAGLLATIVLERRRDG
jgi:uncharacterized membrane protein YedE/YeeE